MRQREELFYLAYYLHWAWSETMTLTVEERKVYVQMLAARIAAENQALEAMSARLRNA